MAQDDKITEVTPEQIPNDSPPLYTPRAFIPATPIHPPPVTSDLPPERIHVPSAPFLTDLTQIGPDPKNVICPRCHYGVCTSTRPRAGMHAG